MAILLQKFYLLLSLVYISILSKVRVFYLFLDPVIIFLAKYIIILLIYNLYKFIYITVLILI
jgi:hypothetical protein